MIPLAPYQPLERFVVTYESLLNPNTCEQIRDWSETLHTNTDPYKGFAPGLSATGHDTNEATEHRICEYAMITEHNSPFYDRIDRAVQHVMQTYPYHHMSHQHLGIQLMRYHVGGLFDEHIDHYSGAPRTLSCSIQISAPQDYEGGGLDFWGGHYTPSMTQGTGVVFPANLCFPHRVKPISRGVRLAIVFWTQ